MDRPFRKQLVDRIRDRIGRRGFCVVYDNDLCQLSKPLEELRAQQVKDIQRFARQHGFTVDIRDIGLNATFRTLPESQPERAAALLSARQ